MQKKKPEPAKPSEPPRPFEPMPHQFEERHLGSGTRPFRICIHCNQRLDGLREMWCVQRSYSGRVKE